jgi:hypothetical protein
MRLQFVRAHKSITEAVTEDDVADFVVLSGPNGSGKSNLLEAIHLGAVGIEGVPAGPPGQPSPQIRLFGLAQLVTTAEGAQPVSAFRDRWLPFQQQIDQLIRAFTQPHENTGASSDQLEQRVKQHLIANRQVSGAALERMLTDANKRLIDFTVEDFRRFTPLLVGVRDPFSLTVGELFLTYHQRRLRNEFLQWRKEHKDAPEVPLSDDEFVAHYGPPPWDLLNETLKLVGLEYAFDSPTGVEDDLVYEAKLLHEPTGSAVRLAELSSGEKTLMAVAMSLYTGSRLGEAIELPMVLLLDETDASLHPSMVQSLLRVTDDIFSKRYGVRVILTTHSPSTVALAPPESLYVIRRSGQPRLRSASRDEALKSLTVGIPTLSVRIENRRQVFVESEHDEACYGEYYRLLMHNTSSEFSLQFIASGKGGQGNAQAVKHLVTSLREAGNDTVLGIVDRDSRQGAPAGIYFISGRYALENLVLDPLVLGAFMLREGILSMTEVGLPGDLRYFEISEAHAQTIVDFVTARVALSGDDTTQVTVAHVGGFSTSVPRFYLDLQGHSLEGRVTQVFPALNRWGHGLKRAVVEKGVGDVPNLAPQEVVNLMEELLG